MWCRRIIRGFVRRREDVDVTVLRFTNSIGPRIDTALTRYFALPVVPTVLGFDARVQLLHEEDALAVLERATRERLPGVFNVGGDRVLLRSQAIRRAGRIPAPIPESAVATVGRLLRTAQLLITSRSRLGFSTLVECWTPPGCAPNSASRHGGSRSRRSMTSCAAGRCGR
jgi:UDP-glucose 4-epimerase